jgi:hypothetical protein
VQVAEEMVRNNTALKAAAMDVGIELEPIEAERISRRRDFQEILRIERNKFHAAVANDPTRTKSTAIGMLWLAAERLEREGEHEKAAGVLERICKVEGWAGADTNVNVFGTLTGKELTEARERILRTLPQSTMRSNPSKDSIQSSN